ncbi:MAG TPA: hypothetical protein VGI50_16090 [Solirubrobacteraceae bacterium]
MIAARGLGHEAGVRPAGNVRQMQIGLIGVGNVARAMTRGSGDPVSLGRSIK